MIDRDKVGFLHYYEKDIGVWFDRKVFLEDESVTVRAVDITLREAGEFYCPWYYDVSTRQEISTCFEEIRVNPKARAVILGDVETTIEFPSKRLRIQHIAHELGKRDSISLNPVPVASDIHAGGSLILDSNHTLVALCQLNKLGETIPILEIRGELLSRIFPDFDIIYRS